MRRALLLILFAIFLLTLPIKAMDNGDQQTKNPVKTLRDLTFLLWGESEDRPSHVAVKTSDSYISIRAASEEGPGSYKVLIEPNVKDAFHVVCFTEEQDKAAQGGAPDKEYYFAYINTEKIENLWKEVKKEARPITASNNDCLLLKKPQWHIGTHLPPHIDAGKLCDEKIDIISFYLNHLMLAKAAFYATELPNMGASLTYFKAPPIESSYCQDIIKYNTLTTYEDITIEEIEALCERAERHLVLSAVDKLSFPPHSFWPPYLKVNTIYDMIMTKGASVSDVVTHIQGLITTHEPDLSRTGSSNLNASSKSWGWPWKKAQ